MEKILGTWQVFFTAVTTAAAALVGLLFLAVSLYSDLLAREIDIRYLSSRTLMSFLGILFISSVLLMPQQSGWLTDLTILMVPALEIGALVVALRVDSHLPLPQWFRDRITYVRGENRLVPQYLWYLVPIVIAYLAALVCSVVIVSGHADWFTVFARTNVLLLVLTTASAWQVMQELAGAKQKSREGWEYCVLMHSIAEGNGAEDVQCLTRLEAWPNLRGKTVDDILGILGQDAWELVSLASQSTRASKAVSTRYVLKRPHSPWEGGGISGTEKGGAELREDVS
jgi:hypothetical protein